MQRTNVYFSRLGTPFLRRSASSASVKGLVYSIPRRTFRPRKYSYQAQASAVKHYEERGEEQAKAPLHRILKDLHSRTSSAVRSQPSVNSVFKNRNARTVTGEAIKASGIQVLRVPYDRTSIGTTSECGKQKRNSVPAHSEYGPRLTSSIVESPLIGVKPIVRRLKARSGRETWSEKIWRPEGMDPVRGEKTEREIEVLRQLHLVEKRLSVIHGRLKIAGKRIEAWLPRKLAEKQLSVNEPQLEIPRRSKKVQRQLNMVKKRSKVTGRHSGDVPRREAAMRQRNMVTMQSQTRKRGPLSTPSGILARWLDTEDVSGREDYWLKNRSYHGRQQLALILVVYLRQSANPSIQLDEFDQSLLEASTVALQRKGFTVPDVKEWVWIVSAPDTKTMVERFAFTSSKKPTFLLLEILRRDILDVSSLKLLLICSWNQLQGKPVSDLITKSEVEIDSVISWSDMTTSHDNQLVPIIQPAQWEFNSFFATIRRLLYQARRIWPPAIVSVAQMVAFFLHFHLVSGSEKPKKVDERTHHRLCKIYNQMLRMLALPSSINPLKSTVHNWQAQRVLLEMSNEFQPRLILDRLSYRAVAIVLAASKKSDKESRAATLRKRSWPPWRVDQDGMDAQRLPEDDLSRVVATVVQAKQSGYNEGVEDLVLQVLGGQDPDRTPTIPTRKVVQLKTRNRTTFSHPSPNDCDAEVWAARIESTRDVQEAWSVFMEYQERGQQATMSMYFAMIVKVQFEGARSGRRNQHKPSPGDGKEVFPPSNDNFSSFYQSRLQPPTSPELYDQMIRAGIRPSGRFLSFLVEHARSPNEGIDFLRDAQIDRHAVALLEGFRTANSASLGKVPPHTLAAYITLLCRFLPRLVPAPLEEIGADIATNHAEDLSPKAKSWRIVELSHKNRNHRRNRLLHCANLLQISRTSFRPAWYALFSGLVRQGVIVDHSLAGDPKNDILAWKVLVAALGDFHNCGLELDPHGFRILCIGAEKALLASFEVPEEARKAILEISPLDVVRDEFMKLSETNETSHPTIPKLLHSIEGAHLHAYARVLGIGKDLDGLMYVLQWMVENHAELDEIAAQSRGGSKHIRLTVLAMKVFLTGTEFEPKAEDLVNKVGVWGMWPQDSEVQSYVDGWTPGDERYVQQRL